MLCYVFVEMSELLYGTILLRNITINACAYLTFPQEQIILLSQFD
jgi:hypothetical protein